MKSTLLAALLLTSALVASPAFARAPNALINQENIGIVTASAKPATGAQVKQAILVAGVTKGWQFADAGAGKLIGTLNVRGKHTIIVNVDYSPSHYSVTYKDSVNMKYGREDGQEVIHPNYNRWVQGLVDATRVELLKL